MPHLEMHVATDSMTHRRFLDILGPDRCHLLGIGGAGKSLRSIISMDLSLRRLVERLKPDIFHRPTGQLPFLRLPGCATVSTVADLHFKTNKQFSLAQRWYKDISYRWTFRRVDRVTAISDFTAGEITRYYGYPTDRITVTHLGVVRRKVGVLSAALINAKPYFVTFAQHSHKNCEAAIRAFHLLKTQGDNRTKLVVVGDNPYVENILKPLAIKLDVACQLLFVGYIADDQLGAIYDGAQGLLFLSRHEGFGLPVVEAFWAGCPVIAARTSSIPEIVGDAGILEGLDDITAIASAIQRINKDRGFRDRLIVLGKQRATLFTWENTANKMVAVYGQAIADRAERISNANKGSIS